VLKSKIEEEMMEGNLLLKLRENFEDKFRYDEAGVPRIWRPTDDIEGLYTKARESTLTLIPLLSRFRHSKTGAPPPLDIFIGSTPSTATPADEEDLTPIGGVDEDEGISLEEETTILTEAKRQDLTVRFKKAADGVYVEAKRSAIGGMTQVPLYFYGLLLALGWNEIWAGKHCVIALRWKITNMQCSATKSCILYLPNHLWCGTLRNIHTESLGSHHKYDYRCIEPGACGGQEAPSRFPARK
jgi:hypothetical protein